MALLTDRRPYSYRDDPTVPEFDDSGPVAFMDGDCVLCTGGARAIARFDTSGAFRICPISTPLGTAMVRHYGLEPGDSETWLFLDQGHAWSGMEAIIRIGERLGGAGRLATVFRVYPPPVREWIYRRIARNRHRFGRGDMCAFPDPQLQSRLIG